MLDEDAEEEDEFCCLWYPKSTSQSSAQMGTRMGTMLPLLLLPTPTSLMAQTQEEHFFR